MTNRREFLTDMGWSLAVTATSSRDAFGIKRLGPIGRASRARAWVGSRRSITLTPDAGLLERTAALELQAFLSREFGHQVPILDRAPGQPGRIALEVGLPRESDGASGESFEVTTEGDALRVSGSEPVGVLQGAFWLERWLGENAQLDPSELRVRKTARFRYRAAMPYFTEAGEVTDEYLRFMASTGQNMLYLAFHPFKKYIDDPIAFPISQILRIRDFVNAPGKDQLVGYANDLFGRAKRYGLDGYVYVMEPWGGDASFVSAHPEAIGRNRAAHFTQPLCLDSGVARDYLHDLVATMAKSVPDLKGIIVMSEDGTTICDDSCPRSTGPRPERRARLFTTLSAGGKSIRSDFRVVAYSWWWDPEDFPAVIGALPKDSLVCTRTSTHAPYQLDSRWKGSPGDVSLLVNGPGRDFEDAVRLGREAGIAVVDMMPISNGHELLTLPVLPAPDRYARKFDVLEQAGGAGWIGYDCGGATPGMASAIMAKALWSPAPSVEAQVRELAEETYGRRGAARAVVGWRQTSDAFQWFPIELDRTPTTGIMAGAMPSQWAPLVPLTLARAHSYRLFPKGPDSTPTENLSQNDWLDFWNQRQVMLDYLPRVRDGLESGVRVLEEAARLAPPERAARARDDVRMATASWVTIVSGIHLLRFWEQLARIPEATTAESRAAIIRSVTEIVAAEGANTRRMLALVRQDRRLFYCACTKYIHPHYISGGFLASGYFTESMTVAEMLEKKLATMRSEDYTGQLEMAFSGCCINLINWGVRP